MVRTYLPALVFVGLGSVIGLAFALLNSLLGPRRKQRQAKGDPYECFLVPVAIQLKAFGTFALVETAVFIGLLVVAFVYVWRRGALEWR